MNQTEIIEMIASLEEGRAETLAMIEQKDIELIAAKTAAGEAGEHVTMEQRKEVTRLHGERMNLYAHKESLDKKIYQLQKQLN